MISSPTEAPSHDDLEQDMDQYCVISPSGAAYYGGIVECRLVGTRLTITFSAEAAGGLSMDALNEYELALTPESMTALKLGLRTVLTVTGRHDKPIVDIR